MIINFFPTFFRLDFYDLFKNIFPICFKLFPDHLGIIRGASGEHPGVIRGSSGIICSTLFQRFSDFFFNCFPTIFQLFSDHLGIIRGPSGDHPGVIRDPPRGGGDPQAPHSYPHRGRYGTFLTFLPLGSSVECSPAAVQRRGTGGGRRGRPPCRGRGRRTACCGGPQGRRSCPT